MVTVDHILAMVGAMVEPVGIDTHVIDLITVVFFQVAAAVQGDMLAPVVPVPYIILFQVHHS
jgi:hypothetical protein